MPRKIINVGRVKGSMWYTGTNPSEVEKPLEGDLYLDKVTFKIYVYENNQWNLAIKKLIPTKVSELTNDSGYIKNTVDDLKNYYLKSETYTKDEVLGLIGKISTMSLEVVTDLPTENISLTTIYLKLSGDEEMNIYEEYIYVNSQWELIGTTKVDLSNYVQKDEVMPIVEENSEEVDTLTVGKSDNYNVESDDQVPTTKAVKQIVDEKIANLVNSAPETLDTLGEVAQALQKNDSVVDALNSAIGNKVDKTYVDEKLGDIQTLLEAI